MQPIMKRLIIGLMLLGLLTGCGRSYEETKRLRQEQQQRDLRADSAALKVAVLPTLDCLPLYVAEERAMFDTVVDIRLKCFTAQMDCDTAIQRGRVEIAVTDLVRAERMKAQKSPLAYLTSTNAYWLLIGNRNQRITNLSHLDDRMLAMTRYSVTDLLGDLAVDSAKLKTERVFRIQVNDVNVRLDMLKNNEMDALLMTEPQAALALMQKHHVLLDTRKLDMQMGAMVEDSVKMSHPNRQRQREVLIKGYNMACDSLNHYGVRHYGDIIRKYYKLSEQELHQLPDTLKYLFTTTLNVDDLKIARGTLNTFEIQAVF